MTCHLIDLLKKDYSWVWTTRCEIAFATLKEAISKEPVLRLPNFGKPFEVHTDTSNLALGGVLVQDGHLVAYESRKLRGLELKYNTYEKELLAGIHALKIWKHYLMGISFLVRTDHQSLRHFLTQP